MVSDCRLSRAAGGGALTVTGAGEALSSVLERVAKPAKWSRGWLPSVLGGNAVARAHSAAVAGSVCAAVARAQCSTVTGADECGVICIVINYLASIQNNLPIEQLKELFSEF